MSRKMLTALAGVCILAWGALVVVGERSAGDVQLDCESLNTCGASFSSTDGVEIGWTIGQHGLHGCASDGTPGDFGLQGGIWTESQTHFAGTLFMFQ